MLGCPIRKSADYIVCANPRSLSQLITSFVASKSLGIPHTLLFTFSILLICTQFLILLSQHVNELGDGQQPLDHLQMAHLQQSFSIRPSGFSSQLNNE
jgi:hypothetical protein